MKENSYKILLCGSNYGRVYIDAIDLNKERSLYGVFSRGSDTSKNLALQNNVPLYSDWHSDFEAIDLAIISTSLIANPILANQFMEIGKKVIIEHPISFNDITQVISASENFGIPFILNSHFSETKPVRDFINKTIEIAEQSTIENIEITANRRTLYSALSILSLITPLQNLIIKNVIKSSELYYTFILRTDSFSISINYQNWINENDDSSDCPVGHSIRVIYSHGNLLLGGTFGPLIWSPIYSNNFPLNMTVQETRFTDHTKIDIIDLRAEANSRVIDKLVSLQHSDDCKENYNRYREVSKLWEALTPTELKTLQTEAINNRLWKVL